MAYPAKAIANFFIIKGLADDKPVDHLKLQKLVYFAHGWNLALYDEPLILERVQAWKFGPVIPSVYHAFKDNGDQPIESPAYEDNGQEQYIPRVDRNDFLTRELLNKIWQVYSKYNGLQLSDMTHKKGTPWDTVWSESHRSIPIPNQLIKSYFQALTEQHGR